MIPALDLAHTEGFSTAIISLGLHIRNGDLRAFDYLYGANLEYFGLSRLGASLAVGALTAIPGVSGEAALRLLVLGGFVGLVAATWTLVRRWTEAPHLVIAAAMLLLPSITESAFFYNDNVPSAALAVGGLALLTARRGLGAAALAGLLFGLGVVTRADAVLLGPAVLLVLYEQEGVTAPAVRRGLVFGLALLVPLIAVYAAFGATFLDVLHISKYTVHLWNRGAGKVRQSQQILLFFSVPGLVLAAAGVAELWRRRSWVRLALLAGVPLLYNVITFGKLWQARQLLPLTPLLVSLVVIGWQALPELVGPRRARLARRVVAGLAAATLFVPSPVVWLEDGPRAPLGRLWNLAEWRDWQREQNDSQRYVRAFASTLGVGGPTAVITDEFTADEYMHLALQLAGFRALPSGAAGPACARTGELWVNGDRRVMHVRLHVPFVTSYIPLMRQRYEASGAPCLEAVRPASLYYLEAISWVDRVLSRAYTKQAARQVKIPVWRPGGQIDSVRLETTPQDSAKYVRNGWLIAKPFVALPVDAVRERQLRRGYVVVDSLWRFYAIPREARFYTELPDAERALQPQVRFGR